MQDGRSGVGHSALERTHLQTEFSLVIHRFASFGRVAHVRRWLLSLPHVAAARIEGYAGGTVRFGVTLATESAAAALVVPGTRIVACDGTTITLQVD